MGIPDRLLCLDVSSAAAGFGCFRCGILSEFGVFRPRARDAAARIDELASSITAGAREFNPDIVVMEWTDGKADVARARQRGRQIAGLAVLGQAQGAVRAALQAAGYKVETVSERQWTAGQPKEVRAGNIALEFAEYQAFFHAGMDPGYDAADAIGLGLFYLGKARLESLVEMATTSKNPEK